jgi:hypothetical protein
MIIVVFGFVAGACMTTNARSDTPVPSLEATDLKEDVVLTAELSAPETLPLCEPVEVEFTITNTGDRTLYLLNWYTPLEGVLGNIFKVTFQGQELSYQGPIVMRAAPLPEQYVRFEAGASETAVVDLSQVYDFTESGEYTITYRSPLISDVTFDESGFAETVDELGPVQIKSSPITVEILPSEGEGECSRAVDSQPATLEDQGEEVLDIKGVVRDVSLSAGVIFLQDEVRGISTIGLLEDTQIVSQDGTEIPLREIGNGLVIRASGKPGGNGALLAYRVVVKV